MKLRKKNESEEHRFFCTAIVVDYTTQELAPVVLLLSQIR
jgi:hypothetical protein